MVSRVQLDTRELLGSLEPLVCKDRQAKLAQLDILDQRVPLEFWVQLVLRDLQELHYLDLSTHSRCCLD